MLPVSLYFLLLIVTVSCVSVVFVFWLSIIDCHSFLCAQCCLCLCIVYYWLSLFHVCPMLSMSLYSLLLIVTVSCVPNFVCVSVLSIIDCHLFPVSCFCLCLCILCYWLWLFPVCPMLCVSLILYYWFSLFPVFSMLSMCLYSLLLIVTVSCVLNVVCVSVQSIIVVTVSCVPNVVFVSVLFIIDCHSFLCAHCCLCLCIV